MADSADIYRAFVQDEQAAMAADQRANNPLAIYQDWQRRLAGGDLAQMGEVVALDTYTEICVGLTGWTTGFGIAWQNFRTNMIEPFSDMTFAVDEVVEGHTAVVLRTHAAATHTGTFLGIPATGRRIAWDVITIVHVKDGRVVGQWAQPDLYGIYQQLTAPQQTSK